MDNQENNEAFNEFEQWRKDILETSTENCTKLNLRGGNINAKENELILNVPKCIVHFTRKMCKCNQECLSKSFTNSDLYFTCFRYDKENLLNDDSYKDCDSLGKRVEGNKLVPVDGYNSMMSIIKNINSGITNLCDSNSDFENLLCKVYDLRDVCKNMPYCMRFRINDVPKKHCRNRLYENQIDEIERILGKKIRSNMLEASKPIVNENSDTKKVEDDEPPCIEKIFLTSNDIIIKINGETKPHLIIKRDLSKIDLPDINSIIQEYDSLDLKFKSIESTDQEQNTFYSMISLSIISTLLFFILVFLGYKDNTNQKIVLPTIFMTLVMLFISIYSTLNN